MRPFIKTEGLTFGYKSERGGDMPVLRGIDLEIEKGSFVAVLGHNGSGKSTLAKLLNLILTPDSGKIYIDGKDITAPDMTEEEIVDVRQKIGMVFQNPDNQLVATVVEEDIAFGPENMGIPSEEIRKRVNYALETVRMTEFARHSPHQLSGGQKQRVAIAGIIAMLPECIIFDESTAMLDPIGRDEVMNTIELLNREKNITIMHITHNMNEAVMADRVIVINDGEVFLDGKPSEVFSEVDKLNTVGLDVPQVTELFYNLRKSGAELPRNIINEEDGAEILSRLLQKK